jgi:hypothetical protein
MNNAIKHSSAWVNFITCSFVLSVFMVGGGIFFMDMDVWKKGYLAMGAIMLIQTSISLSKTLRDNQDADRASEKL